MAAWIFLSGCTAENRELAAAMECRDRLLSSQNCSFQAVVTADYGEELHEFSMDCQADQTGNIQFEITQPKSLAGIRGTIAEEGGSICFEEDALYFPLLTDDQLTPASAPWILLRSLRAGCIRSACREEELLRVTVDDRYEEDALTVDVWMEEKQIPVRGDILYDGKRILSLDIENFVVS